MTNLERKLADVRRDLFGGEGEVLVWNVARSPLPAPFTAALWVQLEAGGRVGRHVQQRDCEVILGIAGEGVMYVDQQPHAVSTGVLVPLPLGSQLEIDNASIDVPFVYAIIKASPMPV